MVSIAGGEPLMHPQIDEIVRQLVARRKYVFLCTNALLLRKKLDKFTPSPYFTFTVHIDGLRERHDASVAKEGTFDEAVAAVKEARRRGFRVTTNSTFFNTDTPQTVIEVLDYLNDELKVDEMMISPAYAYEKDRRAPQVRMTGERRSSTPIEATFEFGEEPAVIRYTTDGSTPNASSPAWDSTGPREPGEVFHITESTTFKWMATDIEGNTSFGERSFTIVPPKG